MHNFTCYRSLKILTETRDNPCYQYAVSELQRILGRLGITTSLATTAGTSAACCIRLFPDTNPFPDHPSLTGLMPDGYALQVSSDGIVMAAPTEKGVLNAVYDLVERLGVLFLMPGEAGEWIPEKRERLTLPAGQWLMNPRFKHRGVNWESLSTKDFSFEEWLCFYAKLRFNAVLHEIVDLPLATKLGLRLEVGGHGLSALLPRDRYAQDPDMFRMAQPEDFGGKRTNDANGCFSNAKTRQLVMDNYAQRLQQMEGSYTVHAFADDLPAGGWCLCPSCRSLPPTDQHMLAMRYLAEAVKASGLPMRVSVLAYHDTMMPGEQIDAPREGFLMFAPRERCYGHALDDSACTRNTVYLKALKAWTAKFRGIDDAHVAEYYFDQILFRGLYPFLPGVILRDMQVYAEHGIESCMSLQIAGPAIAPEFNMLVYAKGQWDASLTPDAYIAALSKAILPRSPEAWATYLTRRARVFTNAMRMCEHHGGISVDYRWLPETIHPFGKEMARVYENASKELTAAAAALESSIAPDWPERSRTLARAEALRAHFEGAELLAMHYQQNAMNDFAEFMNTRSTTMLKRGLGFLEQAVDALDVARAKAEEAKIPKNTWYYKNINGWLTREFKEKIKKYQQFLLP